MTTTHIRSLPVLVLAALLLAAATPPAATASGSYTVTACSPTTSPGAWQQINTFPGGMTSGNQCGGPMIGPLDGGDPGALYGEDLVGSTVHSPSRSPSRLVVHRTRRHDDHRRQLLPKPRQQGTTATGSPACSRPTAHSSTSATPTRTRARARTTR